MKRSDVKKDTSSFTYNEPRSDRYTTVRSTSLLGLSYSRVVRLTNYPMCLYHLLENFVMYFYKTLE